MVNKKGNPDFLGVRNKDTRSANEARSNKANAYAFEIGSILNGYATQGFNASKMADALNAEGKQTTRGKPWSAKAVRRLITRLKKLVQPS